jgi:ABC-type Na+ efflux pump permease subunit
MFKLWIIAHREYVAMVGTKAFLFTLVMMPILMFGSLLAMPVLNQVSGGKTQKIVVSDGTGRLFAIIENAAIGRNASLQTKPAEPVEIKKNKVSSRPTFMDQQADIWEFVAAPDELSYDQRLEYSNQIRNGDIYALVEIPKTFLDATQAATSEEVPDEKTAPSTASAKFYSQDALMSSARSWLSTLISQRLREVRMEQYGLDKIDPKIFAQIDARVELLPSMPIKKSDTGKSDQNSVIDSLVSMFLPFGVMMLMFMVILMAAQPMLESAMEEKSLRISEVLLGSVTPSQLMGGKLLGNVAGSLVIFVLYGAGGLFFLNYQGLSDKIPIGLLPWFLFPNGWSIRQRAQGSADALASGLDGVDGTDDGVVHCRSRAQWDRVDDLEFLSPVLPDDDGVAPSVGHNGSILAAAFSSLYYDRFHLWDRHLGRPNLSGWFVAKRRGAIHWSTIAKNDH